MSKISDFKLAYATIREMSRNASVPVKDIEVSFDGAIPSGLIGSSIHISETSNLPHTLYQIVNLYIKNSSFICGKELFTNEDAKTMFLMHFAATVRSMDADEREFSESKTEIFNAARLYHNSFIWNAMKNIVCPINDCKLQNVLVVNGSSNKIDASVFYDKGIIDDEMAPDEPFVFCNESVRNKPILDAHLLLAAIESHGLKPIDVVKTILEGPIYSKFLGLVKLAFFEEDVDKFMSVFMKISDLKPSDFPHMKVAASTEVKTAQWYDTPGQTSNSQWWWFGLPEKMLEPTRGFDWSVRENLEHWITDFWDEVEGIKEQMPQGEGVPFDNLLRLKADESMDKPTDTNLTIQGLLSDQRIWQ